MLFLTGCVCDLSCLFCRKVTRNRTAAAGIYCLRFPIFRTLEAVTGVTKYLSFRKTAELKSISLVHPNINIVYGSSTLSETEVVLSNNGKK